MPPSPARSADSSMIEGDDPTITLGGLADQNHEPQLIERSPIAALSMKPVLSIDEVITAHSDSFEALCSLQPQENGCIPGYLQQPTFIELSVIKPSGADGRSELSQDGTQAPITKLAVVKEPRTQLNNSPIPVQVNGTTTGAKESTETTTKIVLCVPADAQADNELPHTVVPQASVIDVDADEQNLSPVQLDAVVGKLLNDAQFIEQVARKMIAGQSMPPRQRVHTSANGARSVLVINYKSSLILYCGTAGLLAPTFTFERCGSGEKRYRASVSFGEPKVTFKRPISSGQFGYKHQVREEAAQAAWEYLLSSGAVQGTGFFLGQQHHTTPAPGAELGDRVIDRYAPQRNSPSRDKNVASDSVNDIDPEDQIEPSDTLPHRLASNEAKRGITRQQAPSTTQTTPSQVDEAESSYVRVPKSPSINPARLQMLQRPAPADEQYIPPAFDSKLGPLHTGANLAPLGRRRAGFEGGISTADTRSSIAVEGPRRKINKRILRHSPSPPVNEAKKPYLPPHKRGRDQFEGYAVAERQFSEVDRNRRLQTTKENTPKTMSELERCLRGMAAPLARVDGEFLCFMEPDDVHLKIICRYIAIMSPQYFEVSREGDRVRWGACMPANYLNAHEVTLGPASLTWNEILGKTSCARQFVEPYLMAGIKLHGFGSRQETQIKHGDESTAKRQKLGEDHTDSETAAMSSGYNSVRGDVEQFVHEVKELLIETEPEETASSWNAGKTELEH